MDNDHVPGARTDDNQLSTPLPDPPQRAPPAPPTELERWATAVAHSVAAELMRLDNPYSALGKASAVVFGTRITVEIIRDGQPAPPATPLPTLASKEKAEALAAFRLTPSERLILSNLSRDKPLKATVLAMRCGKPCSGNFRSSLSQLCRAGLAAHTSGQGYTLTAAGLSALASGH